MRTFSIQTLGCKVNQYESDQLATLLRSRGLEQVAAGGDLRVVNTCSVTIQAASKSRQAARKAVRLPVLRSTSAEVDSGLWMVDSEEDSTVSTLSTIHNPLSTPRPKVVLTGCWATSHPGDAAKLAGVDAVLGHHDDVAAELHRLIDRWTKEKPSPGGQTIAPIAPEITIAAKPVGDERSIIKAGASPIVSATDSKPSSGQTVKKNLSRFAIGTRSLPLLNARQSGHQRAMLKIQDGCDAHCTYCIIPQLRPSLWSKPIEDVIEEAQRLVDAGHREIVLTGIFLGAYGQPTALRRRQPSSSAHPMCDLVDAICTQVRGLHRLRFSSLEPGDLTADLLAVMRSHRQVVPHFHLPLQSGSDALLHRMNRQYTRDDFLRMLDRVNAAFDRPAVTTDIIVGFPGETDHEFKRTVDVVNRARFIHIHAFSFSPRPGTAAARWERDFVHGPVVNERINRLTNLARDYSLEFRRQFAGAPAEILVEHSKFTPSDKHRHPAKDLARTLQLDPSGNTAQDDGISAIHGRCERYFDISVEHASPSIDAGTLLPVRITRVEADHTFAEIIA